MDASVGTNTTIGGGDVRMLLSGMLWGAMWGFMRSIMDVVLKAMHHIMFITERYNSDILDKNPRARSQLLKELQRTCIWSEWSFFGVERVGTGWGIDRRLRFAARVQTTSKADNNAMRDWYGQPLDTASSNEAVSVEIVRWCKFTRPLISDRELVPQMDCDMTATNKLIVLRINYRLRVRSNLEVALPTACPTIDFSIALAKRMDRLRSERASTMGGGGFLLSGPPGCGKSIAARCLAHRLDYVLAYFVFDEACDDMFDSLLANMTINHRSGLVLLLDEVDEDLERLLLHDETKFNRQQPGKKAWCTLFDRIQFHSEIVVVATTNKSIAWLREFDDAHFDSALLRDGRFSHMIDCSDPSCYT